MLYAVFSFRVRGQTGLRHLLAALIVGLGLGIAGCSSDSSSSPPRKSAQGARPAHLVELGAASREVLQHMADREGTLRALREVKLFNQEEGSVLAVLAREGDSVKAGQVLVRLDDRLLRAELDKAVATLKQSELDVQRLSQLTQKKLVAEEALTRAQTSLDIAQAQERLLRTRLGYMTITAPFPGKVAMRAVEPGDVAPKHTHLMTVVDPSALVTDVPVSELLLPLLAVGDRAEVRIDALGDQLFPGKVLRVYPTVDPSTRRGKIEVALKPVPAGARPGQFCRVALYPAGGREQLYVSYAAVRRDTQGEHVFVFIEDASKPGVGKVRRTPVKSGLRLADKVEILKGLTVGARVVTKGFLGLADGQTVTAIRRGSGDDVAPAGSVPAGDERKPPEKRDA